MNYYQEYRIMDVKKSNKLISFGEEEEENKIIDKEIILQRGKKKNDIGIEKNEKNENEKDKNNLDINEEKKSESESVSLSESDSEVIHAKKIQNKETQNIKNEDSINKLKDEIIQIKKNKLNPHNKDINIITPVNKYKKEYLSLKTKRLTKEEKDDKLKEFRETLKKLKNSNERSWMKNVLKFQIDSQKAYAIDEFNNMNEKNN